MKKWILIICAGAFLVILAGSAIFYTKINTGDAIQKPPAIVWEWVDNNHITTTIEKKDYYKSQQDLMESVQQWCQENPLKQIDGVSQKVTLTISDREKK